MAKLRASCEALSVFVLTVGKSGNSLIDGKHFTWEISRLRVQLPLDGSPGFDAESVVHSDSQALLAADVTLRRLH